MFQATPNPLSPPAYLYASATSRCLDEGITVDFGWLDPDCTAPPISYIDRPLADILVDNDIIHTDCEENDTFTFC